MLMLFSSSSNQLLFFHLSNFGAESGLCEFDIRVNSYWGDFFYSWEYFFPNSRFLQLTSIGGVSIGGECRSLIEIYLRTVVINNP